MFPLLLPLTRAVGQLDDPTFLGVLVRCLAWSIACFMVLHFAAIEVVQRVLDLHGILGWAAGVLASIGASLLALWLFVPVAVAIGTLYIDRIAASVEYRYYPHLPPARGAPLSAQVLDGLSLVARILALNVLGLILAVILPGIGLLLAWGIAAYAIGRGLFVAVAMRRMPRAAATLVYRRSRGTVLACGGVLALLAYLPILNLLIPILGTAAMVHVLDLALMRMRSNSQP